jgi:hypothetical protein
MNRNMRSFQTHASLYSIRKVKLVLKEIPNEKIWATLLVSIIFVGFLILPAAVFPQLDSSALIRSSGTIAQMGNATSGSVGDIQAAIDWVIAAGGGTVYIPEGTFDFDPRDSGYTSPWWQVTGVHFDVPAGGIQIIGAGKDKTILKYPEDSELGGFTDKLGGFYIRGQSGGKVRISGITIKAQTNYLTSSIPNMGIWLESCTDFRVDHCSFYWMGEVAVWVNDAEATYGDSGGDITKVSQGVVDHCDFIDLYKPVVTQQGNGYGYGVSVARAYHYLWTVPNLYPDDPWTIFGKYEKNTYVEDCYFTGCRHGTQSAWAGAYVLRNSVIEDLGVYEVATTGHPVRTDVLGMFAQEIYNVTIRRTAQSSQRFLGPLVEGGSSLLYDLTLENLESSFVIGSCEDAGNDFYPLGRTKEVYIWDNQIINCGEMTIEDNTGLGGDPAPIEGVHYFLHEPPSEKNYTPYTYPHPLTLSGFP